MEITEVQKNAIDWALDKIQSFDKERKVYNISAIVLSVLDILCGIIAMFYTGLIITSVIASTLCGAVWTNRFIQIVKIEKLAKSLRVLTTASIAYIVVRKKRSEYMKNIKVVNWVIAGLDIAAIILGVILAFVEPSALTNNIEAVIIGIGSLFGVNVAIPCFNNAKVTPEERELKQATKEAKVRLKAKNKESKNQLKEKQKEMLAEEIEKVKEEKQKEKENIIIKDEPEKIE